jgi:aminoglycoside 3-N-acetyltransferase
MIRELIKSLNLPVNEILFLHVRLKGLSKVLSYADQTKIIIESLYEFYNPKTILIPTFTYSFTNTGVYDRVNTPSEVGRFGEEARKLFPPEFRTKNPVFSVLDTNRFFEKFNLDETSAFGKNSLFDMLNKQGHVIININLENIILTFLHHIEEKNCVYYRFHKVFNGSISTDGVNYEQIAFNYFVRKLNLDTMRRYNKVEKYLVETKSLFSSEFKGIKVRWIHSEKLFNDISKKIENDPEFTITD